MVSALGCACVVKGMAVYRAQRNARALPPSKENRPEEAVTDHHLHLLGSWPGTRAPVGHLNQQFCCSSAAVPLLLQSLNAMLGKSAMPALPAVLLD